MYHIKHFLSPPSICVLLILAALQQAQSIEQNVTILDTAADSSMWQRMQNQIDILKSGNDILKLRLEMMELQIAKLGHYFTGIDEKLQNIDDKLQMILKMQLGVQSSPPETEKTQSPDRVSEENSETTNTSVNENIVGEILLGDIAGDGLNASTSVTEKLFMFNANGEEGLKICTSRADKCLVCSDIQLPTSCAQSTPEACWNNKCYIKNHIYGPMPFWVSCNNTFAGDGWTIIQRRINGTVDFIRNWTDYKNGFGNLDGEFWIGWDKLHALANELAPVELIVQLIEFKGRVKYARYNTFAIGDEASKYTLKSLGSYTGTAGDGLRPLRNFAIKSDNTENYYGRGCANIVKGAWWSNSCAQSNLNGRYPTTQSISRDNICWTTPQTYSNIKETQMMIRPTKF